MLTREVTDGVLKLSFADREDLAAFLVESLRSDDGACVEVEIDLEAAGEPDDVDDSMSSSTIRSRAIIVPGGAC